MRHEVINPDGLPVFSIPVDDLDGIEGGGSTNSDLFDALWQVSVISGYTPDELDMNIQHDEACQGLDKIFRTAGQTSDWLDQLYRLRTNSYQATEEADLDDDGLEDEEIKLCEMEVALIAQATQQAIKERLLERFCLLDEAISCAYVYAAPIGTLEQLYREQPELFPADFTPPISALN